MHKIEKGGRHVMAKTNFTGTHLTQSSVDKLVRCLPEIKLKFVSIGILKTELTALMQLKLLNYNLPSLKNKMHHMMMQS